MSIYRVYLPPEANGNFSENFRLIPDGKAIFALIAPPVWLVWHRLWLALMVYIVIAFAISLLAAFKPGPLVGYLSIIPGLYLLLEGRELVINRLRSQGWHEAGVVDADNLKEAEIKFIANLDEDDLKNSAEEKILPNRMPNSTLTGPSIGLFPE